VAASSPILLPFLSRFPENNKPSNIECRFESEIRRSQRNFFLGLQRQVKGLLKNFPLTLLIGAVRSLSFFCLTQPGFINGFFQFQHLGAGSLLSTAPAFFRTPRKHNGFPRQSLSGLRPVSGNQAEFSNNLMESARASPLKTRFHGRDDWVVPGYSPTQTSCLRRRVFFHFRQILPSRQKPLATNRNRRIAPFLDGF